MKKTQQYTQQGFGIVEVICIIALLAVVGFIGWTAWQRSQEAESTDKNNTTTTQTSGLSQKASKTTGATVLTDNDLAISFEYPTEWGKVSLEKSPGVESGTRYEYTFAGKENVTVLTESADYATPAAGDSYQAVMTGTDYQAALEEAIKDDAAGETVMLSKTDTYFVYAYGTCLGQGYAIIGVRDMPRNEAGGKSETPVLFAGTADGNTDLCNASEAKLKAALNKESQEAITQIVATAAAYK